MKLPHDINDVFKKATLIFSKEDIERALDCMAKNISVRFGASNPLFLCVVVGGMIPLGNLLPRLDFPLSVDYIHATRYRGKTHGETIDWKAKPASSMKDRTVIIVDDILDEGLTLTAVINYCREQGAKEVFTAVLVDKLKPRLPGGLEKADFHGLVVDDRYVFGFGLDYKEYLRNAPGIYAVAEEHM